jgi:hypothetical protein
MVHTCNPSYSGGRDQEDHGWKPDPISKKPIKKKAGGIAQGVGPEFKSQYHKNKIKQKKPSPLILLSH